VPDDSSAAAATRMMLPVQKMPFGEASDAAQPVKVSLPPNAPTVAKNEDSPTVTMSDAASAA
jgi:hypothetical protein